MVLAEISEHAKRAKKAIVDVEEMVEDLEATATQPNVRLRYAVDASEVYSYAHLAEYSRSEAIRIFPSDSPSQLAGLHAALLDQLLKPKDPVRRPILLAPYHVELSGFLEALRADATGYAAIDLVDAIASIEDLESAPILREALAKIRRGEDFTPEQLGSLVTYIQEHGQALVWLVENPRQTPLLRLVDLLRRRSFVTLDDAMGVPITIGGEVYRFWHEELQRDAPPGKSEAATRLDAQALALLEATASISPEQPIVLISRSNHVQSTVRRVSREHPHRPRVRVRHPRSLIAVRLFGEGDCTALGAANVRNWVDALRLFVRSHDDIRMGTDPRGLEVLGELLGDARRHWDELLGLVCAAYAFSRTSDIDNVRERTERNLLTILSAINDKQIVREAIGRRMSLLEQHLAASYEVLGVALQVPGSSSGTLEPAHPELTVVGRSASLTVRLAKMPYALEFESENVREWIRPFTEGKREYLEWHELFELFRQSWMQEIGYERLLAMAYAFGSWGRWDAATAYCEHALRRARQELTTSYHQGLVFLAVCLRMPRNQKLSRYRRALALLNDAVGIKRTRLGSDDSRAHREAAAIILLWRYRTQAEGDNWKTKNVPPLSRAEIESDIALSCSDATDLLRAEVHGNLCFYYLASPLDRNKEKALHHFEQTELLLRQLYQTPLDWPPQFLDLYGWGSYSLEKKQLTVDKLHEFAQYVRDATAQFIANPFRRRMYKQHLIEIENEIRERGER